jgi:hypothetical protein
MREPSSLAMESGHVMLRAAVAHLATVKQSPQRLKPDKIFANFGTTEVVPSRTTRAAEQA